KVRFAPVTADEFAATDETMYRYYVDHSCDLTMRARLPVVWCIHSRCARPTAPYSASQPEPAPHATRMTHTDQQPRRQPAQQQPDAVRLSPSIATDPPPLSNVRLTMLAKDVASR